MAEGEGSTADNMKKGLGIIDGYKTVGMGLKGEADHPEVTGVDPDKRGPGRPPANESSFTTVGKSADQEQGTPKGGEDKKT